MLYFNIIETNRSRHIKQPRDMQMRFQGRLGHVLFLYLANTLRIALFLHCNFEKTVPICNGIQQ